MNTVKKNLTNDVPKIKKETYNYCITNQLNGTRSSSNSWYLFRWLRSSVMKLNHQFHQASMPFKLILCQFNLWFTFSEPIVFTQIPYKLLLFLYWGARQIWTLCFKEVSILFGSDPVCSTNKESNPSHKKSFHKLFFTVFFKHAQCFMSFVYFVKLLLCNNKERKLLTALNHVLEHTASSHFL